jgi:hypothetical protein
VTRATGGAALASGLAIGVAPFGLAILADHVGLRQVYLIVLGLLAAAALSIGLETEGSVAADGTS